MFCCSSETLLFFFPIIYFIWRMFVTYSEQYRRMSVIVCSPWQRNRQNSLLSFTRTSLVHSLFRNYSATKCANPLLSKDVQLNKPRGMTRWLRSWWLALGNPEESSTCFCENASSKGPLRGGYALCRVLELESMYQREERRTYPARQCKFPGAQNHHWIEPILRMILRITLWDWNLCHTAKSFRILPKPTISEWFSEVIVSKCFMTM